MITKPRNTVLSLILVLGLALPRHAAPCSSFAFPHKGFPVFGTNYDNRFAPGQLFINKRGVRKSGWEAGTAGQAPARTKPASTFAFSFDVTLPAPPVEIYDALTGDITGWWDHSFAEKPFRLYIEPRPGGGFYEIFDVSGDGARHATVIYAERGKRLRFEGPLGLSGQAVSIVTTYDLAASGKSATRLTVSVHGAGEIDDKAPGVVEQVWRHFILERFKPYIESGGHRTARR